MSSFLAALGFLTVFPVSRRSDAQRLDLAKAYFPLVGLVLGAVLALLDLGFRKAFPPLVTSAVLVAILLLVTRGLHLEGFLDCCDALPGGFTPERRLEIMKDPRRGSFAIMGGIALVAMELAVISAMPAPARTWTLALFPCLSRWAMLMALVLFPYARNSGLGVAFKTGRRSLALSIGLTSCVFAATLLGGWAGISLVVVATLSGLALAGWMSSLLGGGLTGDTYGAINELAALAVLLTSLAITSRAPELFHGPLATWLSI